MRALRLVAALLRRPRTLESLSTQFGVTTRTIRRDLALLSKAGFAVKRHDGDLTHWSIAQDGICPVCHSV